MSYETHELIRCDKCRVLFEQTILLEFGMSNFAVMERLTRMAMDAGWGFVPSDPGSIPGRPAYSRHFCPACKDGPKAKPKPPKPRVS